MSTPTTPNDKDLRGLIVQATGVEGDSKQVTAIVGSFKALRSFADFSPSAGEKPEPAEELSGGGDEGGGGGGLPGGINLGYTINLHLPATSDIAVFNAIFKSLREHLLR